MRDFGLDEWNFVYVHGRSDQRSRLERYLGSIRFRHANRSNHDNNHHNDNDHHNYNDDGCAEYFDDGCAEYDS